VLVTVEEKEHPGTGYDFNRRVTLSTPHAYPIKWVEGRLVNQTNSSLGITGFGHAGNEPYIDEQRIYYAFWAVVPATAPKAAPIMRFVDWHGNLYYQYRHYTQRFSQNTDWSEAARVIDQWIRTGPKPDLNSGASPQPPADCGKMVQVARAAVAEVRQWVQHLQEVAIDNQNASSRLAVIYANLSKNSKGQMTYTWQEIEQDWLGGGSGLAASPDEVLSAFNEVAARFGRDWVEATRTRNGITSRGDAPTLYIVTQAQLLRALDGVSNTQGLLEKLRQNDPDARAELIAIYLMRTGNPAAVVEAEPEVQVGTRNRKPDFRAQIAGVPWTYVEVTNPNTSDAQADVRRELEQLTGLVDGCSGNFALEVFLKREPSAAELDLIKAEIRQGHQTAAQFTIELPSGLGTMHWNQQPPGAMVLDDHGEPIRQD